MRCRAVPRCTAPIFWLNGCIIRRARGLPMFFVRTLCGSCTTPTHGSGQEVLENITGRVESGPVTVPNPT